MLSCITLWGKFLTYIVLDIVSRNTYTRYILSNGIQEIYLTRDTKIVECEIYVYSNADQKLNIYCKLPNYDGLTFGCHINFQNSVNVVSIQWGYQDDLSIPGDKM